MSAISAKPQNTAPTLNVNNAPTFTHNHAAKALAEIVPYHLAEKPEGRATQIFRHSVRTSANSASL